MPAQITVPPGAGHFPKAGHVRCDGTIVRMEAPPDPGAVTPSKRCHVAAEFHGQIKLSFLP